MDKIEKSLAKFSAKEREIIKDVLRKLTDGDFMSLNNQKLKGNESIFRVRKGGIRIIYRKNSKGEISVLTVERRSEKTYRKF